MFTWNRLGAPQRERDGRVSRVLLAEGDVAGGELAVTWVEVAPGSGQRPHGHAPQQVYAVVEGRGTMRVGEEERTVGKGELVYSPPNAVHDIENASDQALVYVSAATPNIDWRAIYDAGPLRGRDGEEGA